MSKQDRSLPVNGETKETEGTGTATLPVSAVAGGDASSWIKAANASEQTPEETVVASRSIDPTAVSTSDVQTSPTKPSSELTEENDYPEVASRGLDSTSAAAGGLAALGAVGAAGMVASGSFGETRQVDEEEDIDGQEIVDDGFDDYSSDEDEDYRNPDGGSYDRSIIYSPAGVPIGTTLPPIPEENEVLGEEGELESSMLPVEITAPPDAIEAIETVVEEEPVSRNSVLAKVKQWNQSDDDKEAVEAYMMSREYAGGESPTSSPGVAARGGGTEGTGAVVNELTSKWNTAVVEEEQTRAVARSAEGGSHEVVEGLTSKWNDAVNEEVKPRSAVIAPGAGSTKVVDGLTSKWNNAVNEEVQTRSVVKAKEASSTEVVEGLTSKWNNAVKDEADPSVSSPVAASRDVSGDEVVQSSNSVKNMTAKWMDTKADEEIAVEKPKIDGETAAPGVVRSLSAKWAIGKVGESEDQSRTIVMDDDEDIKGKNAPISEARSVQPMSPINPGTVDALQSMWSSPKADPVAPSSVDPTSPVNPGTVDALSSMWSSPKAEEPTERSVAAPSPISPGSVNEITTKWKDIAAETEPNVLPAVAVGATAGTVAAMTGKWASGKKEPEETPLARSISQDEKGDVGKLKSKWAAVETAVPVGTAAAVRSNRRSKGFRPKPRSVDTDVAEVTEANVENGSRSIAVNEPLEAKAENTNGKPATTPIIAPVEPVIKTRNVEEYDDDDDDDEFEDTFDEPIGAFPIGLPVSNPKPLDLDAEIGNAKETNATNSTFRESPTSSSSKKVGGDSTERSVLAGVVQEKTKADVPQGSEFVFEDNVIPLVKEKNQDDLPKVRDASVEVDDGYTDVQDEALVIEDNVISEWNSGPAKKTAEQGEAMPTVASFAEDGSDVVSEWKETGESSKVVSEWKAENDARKFLDDQCICSGSGPVFDGGKTWNDGKAFSCGFGNNGSHRSG